MPDTSQVSFWASLIGAVSGVVSLFLIIFSVGRKVGQLETKLGDVDKRLISEREWGELGNKVETLYRVYVLEALSGANNGDGSKKGKGR